MANISDAFRRGYKRGIADAAVVAHRRVVACAEAVARYETAVPPSRHAAASERCAQYEAQHIRETILQLKPVQDGD